MKKIVIIILVFVTLTSVSAQQDLNDYKYIIVPETFDFLSEADEYRLNSLTKFLFEKYNFETLLENETYPSDYAKNNCLGLKANVLKDSNLFKTKLSIELKNCKNEVVFTSAQGESRDKSNNVAYNQALRSAFKSFEAINYTYNPEKAITINDEVEIVEVEQVEIEKEIKEEIKVLKEEKVKKVEKVEEVLVENTSELVSTKTEEKEAQIQEIDNEKTQKINNSRLRAEIIPNSGMTYNLFNSNGDKIYTILFSGKVDLYIVKDIDAIIYKLNDKWVIAEALDNNLQLTALDIKF